MMERAGSTITLENGYSICKMKLYNGYTDEYFWTVWAPNGMQVKNLGSYEKAVQFAREAGEKSTKHIDIMGLLNEIREHIMDSDLRDQARENIIYNIDDIMDILKEEGVR